VIEESQRREGVDDLVEPWAKVTPASSMSRSSWNFDGGPDLTITR
jgi:hypothetical protein